MTADRPPIGTLESYERALRHQAECRGDPPPDVAEVTAAFEAAQEAHKATSAAVNGTTFAFGPAPAESSWRKVDVAAVLERGLSRPAPTMLLRDDGAGLIYPGKMHAINGEPEAGKGWLALALCAERIRAGEDALYLDFESDVDGILERLLAMGTTEREAAERFHYVRPDEPFDQAARAQVLWTLDTYEPTVAVPDGVAEAMTLTGHDEGNNRDITAFYTALPRLLERAGCASVLIDHLTKDRETQGRYARGGGAKLAGITGASYKLEAVRPFGRGMTGMAKLLVTKDRPGSVRPLASGSRVAEVELASGPDGEDVTVTVRAPVTEGAFRPTFLMERVSRMLELSPDALTGNQVCASTQGKREAVLAALRCLVEEGHVSREPGTGRAVLHRSIRPFREVVPGGS